MKVSKFPKALMIGAALLASAATASATTLFSDDFSYGDGDLSGQGSWFGGGTIDVSSGQIVTTDGNFTNTWATLGSTISATTDGTYYFGGTFTGGGANSISLGLGTAAFGSPADIGTINGSYLAGGSAFAGSADGTPTLLVGRLDISASGADTLYLWADPATGAEPTLASAASISVDVSDDLIYARVVGNFGAGAAIDDVVFATTYAEVVGTVIPEPSTYAAIFGAVALGFAVYRRRKQAKAE